MSAAPHQSQALAAILAPPPAIQPGGSTQETCTAAEDYKANVKRLRLNSTNATTADVEASKMYVFQNRMDAAGLIGQDGVANLTQKLNQLTNTVNVISANLAQLTNTVNVISANLAQLTNTVNVNHAALTQNQNNVVAMLTNDRTRDRNRLNGDSPEADAVYFLLMKETPDHPAGTIPQNAVLGALNAPVPVQTTLPALHFITGMAGIPNSITRAEVLSLTINQLNDLQWFYNELFYGNSVVARRNSFLNWLYRKI